MGSPAVNPMKNRTGDAGSSPARSIQRTNNMKLRYIALIAIALSFAACTDEELSATTRAVSGAYNGYYGRPAYYGQPTQSTTVVTPAAPVIY